MDMTWTRTDTDMDRDMDMDMETDIGIMPDCTFTINTLIIII